jgi:hypothetical protein
MLRSLSKLLLHRFLRRRPFWEKWQPSLRCLPLQQSGKTIHDQVRFARARGCVSHDLFDFVAALIGYAVSGEPTRLPFYEWLTPLADALPAGQYRLGVLRSSRGP